MSLLATVLPALIPAASDGIRAIINRVTNGAGAKPVNVDEAIKLIGAETDRLRVVQQLDAPGGEIYKWAATARALQRPALATWILLAYMVAMMQGAPAPILEQLAQLAGMVTFYLFGDRSYSAIKGSR
jgi:hypothetical protein